jgi:hypothetical protein
MALGAPVANRANILPDWFGGLRGQTLQPDQLCFVYSPTGDRTRTIIEGSGYPVTITEYKAPFFSRDERNGDPKDPNRAKHFTRLRNTLRRMFLDTDADVFISLDTDIMLTDETALERLVDTLSQGWDVAAPLTCLHPAGFDSHCYNAGWWTAGDPGDPNRVWRRAERNDVVTRRSPVQVDFPMAAYAIRRHTMALCRYAPFECGEDLGFGDALNRHQARCAWLTDLRVPHIWDEHALKALSPA